tara:strand:- start:548 stop:802 length:255 start_codon:yes stop_codon:yes gene_type:complete
MGNQREVVGVVVKDALDKGVTVSVERRVSHAVYGKIQRRSKTFMAHDEHNSAKVGDRVLMVESRPLSKNKRFVVTRVLDKADTV